MTTPAVAKSGVHSAVAVPTCGAPRTGISLARMRNLKPCWAHRVQPSSQIAFATCELNCCYSADTLSGFTRVVVPCGGLEQRRGGSADSSGWVAAASAELPAGHVLRTGAAPAGQRRRRERTRRRRRERTRVKGTAVPVTSLSRPRDFNLQTANVAPGCNATKQMPPGPQLAVSPARRPRPAPVAAAF